MKEIYEKECKNKNLQDLKKMKNIEIYTEKSHT